MKDEYVVVMSETMYWWMVVAATYAIFTAGYYLLRAYYLSRAMRASARIFHVLNQDLYQTMMQVIVRGEADSSDMTQYVRLASVWRTIDRDYTIHRPQDYGLFLLRHGAKRLEAAQKDVDEHYWSGTEGDDLF